MVLPVSMMSSTTSTLRPSSAFRLSPPTTWMEPEETSFWGKNTVLRTIEVLDMCLTLYAPVRRIRHVLPKFRF